MNKVPFRLAMRVEGEWWNAYIAKLGTMSDAKLIGSICMVAASDERIKDAFMQLMIVVVSKIAADLGIKTAWPDPPEAAPEHERAGRG
jgi:hypothetical protein